MQQNVITCHTANIIGRAHKLGKQNRQQPGITNNTSNTTSSTSHSHYRFSIQTPILRHTLVLLNKGPVLGIQVEFILRTPEHINLWPDTRTVIGYLIGDYSVLFLVMEDVFNIPGDQMMMAIDLCINDIRG